jgi:hypothetical protein
LNERLRGNSKLSRHFQWASDIRVFRAVIEDNQLHAMRTLHLIAMLEFDGPLGKGLTAFGAYALNSSVMELSSTDSSLIQLQRSPHPGSKAVGSSIMMNIR